MNGLAIDTAVSKITISAKKEDHTVSEIFDIGMKQSETLLPAIQHTLEKIGLPVSELNYICIANGPGSFTGLRLGFSAAKAIEMKTSAPLYGIDTLDIYAENYKNLPFVVLSCIDAKKDRFYAKAFMNKKEILKDGDYTPEEIAEFIKNCSSETIFICGSGSAVLSEQLKPLTNKNLISADFNINSGEILFSMTEKKILAGEKPLNDYDGPVYLRASEAEVKHNA